MKKEYKYIFNVGSSRISLTGVYIEKGYSGRFFYKEYKHDGSNKGFFKNPEKLVSIMEKLLAECSDSTNKEIKSVYILLQQRFFRSKNNVIVSPIKNGIVNEFDVEELLSSAYEEMEDYQKMECIPIAFRTQDDYVDDPRGQEGESLEMVYVSVGILSRIKEFFDDVAKRLDVTVTIIPVLDPILEQTLKEFDGKKGSKIVLYFSDDTIDVCYCEMGAVISSATIEVGNSVFVEDLKKINKVDSDVAEELLRHINLNVMGESESEIYAIGISSDIVFPVYRNNSLVKKILGYIGECIKSSIESLIGQDILPVYMTGADICDVKGVDKNLSEYLGTSVTVLRPDYLVWTDASDYAIVGLINSFID